jgi:AcrR family transcriptional regulator
VARPLTPLLSRELIVDAALDIIDTDGVAGLSMRRLAAALGVRGPSIYHHFRRKDEILEAIVERINSAIDLERAGPGWEQALASYAYQLRDLLIEHPQVVEFLALRPVTSDSGLRIYEHMISTLTADGWTISFSRDVTIAVENLVYGAALMANAPDIDLSAEQRARFPTLARYADQPPHERPDDGFETGFRALIEGLRHIDRSPHATGAGSRRMLDEMHAEIGRVPSAGSDGDP